MTTSFKKRRNKKIPALFLASFMLVAAGTSLAACGSNDDSSTDNSEVTETETDNARIKNGSFEFFDDNNGKNLIITSPTSWSKSTNSSAQGSASSSKAASGIVDTSVNDDEDAWKDLTEYSVLSDDAGYSDAEAAAKSRWSEFSQKDKLKFYDLWEEAYKDDDDAELTDFSFYDEDKDNFNISLDDVPDCENPDTHYRDGDEDKDDNTHVLMLHNTYSNGQGTAQKYTSSTTITVEAGTSAKLSVWVKTLDMTFNGTSDTKGPEVNGNRGAYIGVTHTVGGTTLDQVQVKNINTQAFDKDDEVKANGSNGWYQYTFYLKGCSYASSTFTLVLGLGQGGGTDKFGYVDGYAFFDDAECEIIRNSKYEEYVAQANISENDIVTIYKDANERLFETDKTYKNVFDYAIDLHAGFESYTWADDSFDIAPTQQKSGITTYVSGTKNGKTPDGAQLYGQLSLKYDNDVTELLTYNQLKSNTNSYLQKVVAKDFKETDENGKTLYPFDRSDDNKILMLLSTDGVAHTAKLNNTFTVDPDHYLMISFWVKTSDLSGFTGAGVTLSESEGTNETSLSSLDTTSVATVDIDGEDGELEEDIYDGWQQCFFFVENTTEEAKSFTLSFTYGPTTIVGTSNSDYYAGYAAFTNFETFEMTEKQFSYAATGTYAKSVSLTGNEVSASEDAGFDSVSSIPDKAIEEGLAIPKNYNGVYGGSGYVVAGGEDKTVNEYAYAGLLNKKYEANYFDMMTTPDGETDTSYWLNKLTGTSSTVISQPNGWWSEIFGTATQPLLIYNDKDMKSSYGYIGASQTISSSSYATVAVRVKVSAGALAYIYLIDTSENRYDSTLSISAPKYTYWYNDDGDLCTKDPSDSDFDKKTDIAFYLNEDNGLYEVNRNWAGANADSFSGKYFANLSNYEKDEEGNLIVADGGVSYNYDDSKWKHQGNDGIAFYYNKEDKLYYAHYDGKKYSLPVYDFQSAEAKNEAGDNVTPRFAHVDKNGEANAPQSLYMILDNREGQLGDGWITCTFYIHTGSEDKNYRLEVWSGNREGTETSNADSYVIFDASSPDSVSSFDDLTKEAIDRIIDQHNATVTNEADKWLTEDDVKKNYEHIFYHAYSFLDSAEFLRYDSTLDEDEVGNKYTSYTSSSYSEGISYLYYINTEDDPSSSIYTMFVDYGYTEVSVTADTTDTDDNTTDTDDEDNDTNMWLFISSLIIAVALIIAVVGLVVQKIVKKAHLKKARATASNASSLNAAKRRYTKPAKAEPEKKEEVSAKKEDNNPYND